MSARLDTALPWKGVCFYEDFRSGLRAKHLWDRVQQAMSSEHEPAMQLWRTDLLNVPWVDREVCTEATRANIVIVSVHDLANLSIGLLKWLARWLNAQNPQPRALVLLPDAERESKLVLFLRRMAQEAGVSVFVDRGAGPVGCGPNPDATTIGSTRNRMIGIEWADDVSDPNSYGPVALQREEQGSWNKPQGLARWPVAHDGRCK